MDKIEGLIKRYFEEERSRFLGTRRDALYPSADDIHRYLNEKMSGAELERMLDFLRGNKDGQDLMLKAREVFESEGALKASPAMIDKAKALMGKGGSAPCPHCGKPVTPFRKPLSAQKISNFVWLAVAAAAFLLSFAFPRYFMQFLLASALAGIKAIVDMKATRTQIMVYKALSEDGEGHRLHTESSRL